MIELPPKTWQGSLPEWESVGPYGDQVDIASMPLQSQQLRWIILSIEKIVVHYDCVIVPQFVITGTELTTGWMIGALPRDPNGQRKKVVPLGNRDN